MHQKQKKYLVVAAVLLLGAAALFLVWRFQRPTGEGEPKIILTNGREEVLSRLNYETIMAGSDGTEGGVLTPEEKIRAYELMVERLRDSIAISPDPDLFLQLATIYYNLEEKQTALDVLQEAKELYPDDQSISDAVVVFAGQATGSGALAGGEIILQSTPVYSVELNEKGEVIREGEVAQ